MTFSVAPSLVATRNGDGSGFVPLGTLGNVNSLKFSDVYPGGNDALSCVLQTAPTYRHVALNPGRIVEVYRGASKLWEGILGEPVPTDHGWEISATGAGHYGDNFRAIYSTYNADEPVNNAISRGLRWVNPGMVTYVQPGSSPLLGRVAYGALNSSSGTTWASTVRLAVGTGNTVLVFVGCDTNAVSTVTDSRGNSYSRDYQAPGGSTGNRLCEVWRCASVGTALQPGDTITVTLTGASANGAAMTADGYQHLGAPDATGYSWGPAGTQFHSSATLTSYDGIAVSAGLCYGAYETVSSGSPFNETGTDVSASTSGGLDMNSACCYPVSAGARACTWSWDNMHSGVGITVGYPVTAPSSGWQFQPFLLQPQDSGAASITDHLTLITKPPGAAWHVDRHNVLTVRPIPKIPTRVLMSSAPAARSLAQYINALYGRYQSAADNPDGSTAATYALTSAANATAITKHQRIEAYWDLTTAGTLSSGTAGGYVSGALAQYDAISWAGPLPARHGQYLTPTGVPVDLGCEKAGECVLLLLADGPYGGEVTIAPPVTFTVGSFEYDDTTQTANITPYRAVPGDMSSLLDALASELAPPAVTSGG